jgi:hypothetical protein
MPSFHPSAVAWMRTHHGVISRHRLLELGVTRSAIEAMLLAGELVCIHEGVYRHALWPATLEAECAAVCAADPTLVICCGGATALWNFRGCGRIGLHVTTTSTGHLFTTGPKLHRCRAMPSAHVFERSDGIRVTSPARTMFDISRHVPWRSLESAIEQGLRRGQFDVPTLYEVGRQLCRRGRAGSALFAAVITSRPAWRRPVDSHPELILRTLLDDVGVHLRPQVSLRLPNGQTIHPDLGDPAVGFYIEIDDHEWHSGRLASTYDDQRDRQVRLGGGWIERVSTDEITPVRPGLLGELRETYRRQASRSVSTG